MTAFALLTGGAAITTALAGGVLYAFSAFVIAGLRRLPPEQAGAAMRGINIDAQRAPLMLLMVASLGLPIAAAIVGGNQGSEGAPWAIAGAVVAAVGILGITAAGNVPLNERLARASDIGAAWQRFVGPWLLWNHARTALAAIASALFVVALIMGTA
ncbi:anthrone oxygenase family protein [Demequina muriae]|uniref:DUF1772 domain-containing protein n=1 Tax=Demequina muriae TaxID=3051664 RepID=A0ABT8GFL2_9MICO|nr:anthrone oxygenase family protein [Demequina sp. EGI L300058]MDN4480217.1 DUF1772 domain-containing protein [Demequina sp. EGI L300058]